MLTIAIGVFYRILIDFLRNPEITLKWYAFIQRLLTIKQPSSFANVSINLMEAKLGLKYCFNL